MNVNKYILRLSVNGLKVDHHLSPALAPSLKSKEVRGGLALYYIILYKHNKYIKVIIYIYIYI